DGDVTLTVLHSAHTTITARANGPYTIAEGQSLTLSAVGSSSLDGDPLTYSWDVNGDGVYGDATGINPTLTWAQLVALGINVGPTATQVVTILAVQLQADPCIPGQTALVVGGTTGNDTIIVNSAQQGVTVKINGATLGTFQPTGRIVVYAQAGDDDIQVAGGI